MGQMLVKVGLRCLPILLWNAAKHESPVYVKAQVQVVTIP
jgi:hypothetical protein